jgi:hypothetical protein
MNRYASILISPLLCIGVLGALWTQKRSDVKAEDAIPFHEKAKAAIDSFPYPINGWYGHDEEITPAAVKLLHPNAMMSRTYLNPSKLDRTAGVLIVQCTDSRDMLGHYPPICYPAHGMTLVKQTPRDWKLDDVNIPGIEYEFVKTTHERQFHMFVYNFMIVPGWGIVRDMSGVAGAAKDYQLRYYGAAQFQVTFPSDTSPQERDEIFATLLGPNVGIINTLRSGGLKHD